MYKNCLRDEFNREQSKFLSYTLLAYLIVISYVSFMLPIIYDIDQINSGAGTANIIHKVKPIEKVWDGPIRTITAYNLRPEQTDSSPCISASGDDVCKILEMGGSVCAANFVPLGTILEIENYGYCEVLDRTSSRFGNRVDIAMPADSVQAARKFGVKKYQTRIVER